MITLTIFVLSYLLFVLCPKYKAEVGLIGSLLLILSQQLSWSKALFDLVNWNVVGLFFGTLLLAELFRHSRVPAVFAEWLVDKTSRVSTALMSIFVLTSVISMFVENVAVVLLVGPVAMALCEKIKVPPFKPMILLAMFSNLQGTATLIGDPPSMILGGFMKMTFNDFFIYEGKLSIFFIVQVGALGALLYAWYLLKEDNAPIRLIPIETIRSWIPTVLLVLLVLILAVGSFIDPEVKWLAGSAAMLLAAIGFLWHAIGSRWVSIREMLSELDWKTTLFFINLFILVGAVQEAGWLDQAAKGLSQWFGHSKVILFIAVITVSVALSAFIDNVPYLLAALPVIKDVAIMNQISPPLLLFALLVGACLGGNITPIGASANIVAVSLLERKGKTVTFSQYVPIGLIFTLCAVIPSSIFLWLIWS